MTTIIITPPAEKTHTFSCTTPTGRTIFISAKYSTDITQEFALQDIQKTSLQEAKTFHDTQEDKILFFTLMITVGLFLMVFLSIFLDYNNFYISSQSVFGPTYWPHFIPIIGGFKALNGWALILIVYVFILFLISRKLYHKPT